MDSKNIWVTIVVAAVVAIIVSLLSSSWGLQFSPSSSRGMNATPVNEWTNVTPVLKLPDLIIQSITATKLGSCTNSSGNSSCSVAIQATVKNIGRTTAGASHALIYLQTGQSSVGAVSSLTAGQTAVVSKTFYGVPAGPNIAYAVADNWNEVSESNENNNVNSKAFTL